MKLVSIQVALCAACIFVNSTYAQDSSDHWSFVTQWDNDILTGTDRGYTNGVRIALVYDIKPEQESNNKLHHAPDDASGAGFDQSESEEASRISLGVGITQLMYTPDDPDALIAPAGERPYAGWLGAEFSLSVSNVDSFTSLTFSIGTTGEDSYAEETQEWVHVNISDSPVYQGWDSQVPSEVTLNLHINHKQKVKLFNFTRDWPIAMDGYYELGTAIGNFRTNAYLGGLIRTGFNLPDAHATPRVQLGSYGQALFVEDKENHLPFSFYGFVGIRGTAVLHDITLDGPVFVDDYYDEKTESEPLVAELIVGAFIQIYSIDFSISQTTRTDEFKGQLDNHRFGSVMLRADLPF